MVSPDSPVATDEILLLVRQLREVSSAIDAGVRDVLADFELTESAGALLWMLAPGGPPRRMRELAGALGCDPSNVTLIGDRLAVAGLVVRRPHPEDRRSRVMVLTEAGAELRRRLLRHLAAATPVPGLSARERRQLGQLLVKLGANREPDEAGVSRSRS